MGFAFHDAGACDQEEITSANFDASDFEGLYWDLHRLRAILHARAPDLKASAMWSGLESGERTNKNFKSEG